MLNTLKAPQPLSFIPGNDDGGTSGCHDRIDLTPSNMVLNVLGPCVPGSAVSLSTSSSSSAAAAASFSGASHF
jgi:hypothetical protein